MNESHDTLCCIAAHEIVKACAAIPDLEQRLRKAMSTVVDEHWLLTTENDRFRAAIGAVYIAEETTDEERRRIDASVRVLSAVNSAQQGLPIDWEELFETNQGIEGIPLLRYWLEEKERAGATVQ